MNILDKFIINHIDFGTLGILFCLMAVAEGFKKLGYIDMAAQVITKSAKSIRSLMSVLTAACFVVSMLVTNDVALIIFVPFTVQVLGGIGRMDKLIKLVVLETLAANLGSMMTPFGNPQNVYLYQYYRMNLVEFFTTLLPYGVAAIILFIVILILDKNGKEQVIFQDELKNVSTQEIKDDKQMAGIKAVIYVVLFIICILAVIGIVDYRIAWVLVIIMVFVMAMADFVKQKNNSFRMTELEVLFKVNYSLLIKFIILFVLVGNIGKISFIHDFLQSVTQGNEFLTGVVASQAISNVPAAVMLSKFTENGTELMLGCDIGGLGTLIASMASMISLECYGVSKEADKKKYIQIFTIYNVIFLLIMLGLRIISK